MNILLIANCRLGDSLVMLPALRSLRQRYPDARIVLASEQAGQGYVAAQDILGGHGLIDAFVPMESPKCGLLRAWKRLLFCHRMRREQWDVGIVMMPPVPPLTMSLVRRFSLYLKWCGVPKIIAPLDVAWSDKLVSEQLLELLEPLGIQPAGFELPPSRKAVDLPAFPEGKRLLAVAPGANMPLKVWGNTHFATVLKLLPPEVHPIYIGGENERVLCEELNREVPGTLFVGHSMAEVEAAMRQCRCYLGNDTGLMHLAAACGLKCVALFSGHSKGRCWEPFGRGHAIFRHHKLDCEGCLASRCPRHTRECMGFDEADVAKAVAQGMEKSTIVSRRG